jgi:hypothetical protein
MTADELAYVEKWRDILDARSRIAIKSIVPSKHSEAKEDPNAATV